MYTIHHIHDPYNNCILFQLFLLCASPTIEEGIHKAFVLAANIEDDDTV